MQSVLLQKSYSLNEFARQNAIGFTPVRGEIKAGRVVARKVGRRTIIAAEDAKGLAGTAAKKPNLQRKFESRPKRCRCC